MKPFLLALWVLLSAAAACAQGSPGQSNYPISGIYASGAPSGTCPGQNIVYIDSATGNLYTCPTAGGSWVLTGGGAGPVTSVFGRTGAVTAGATDYAGVTNLQLSDGNGAAGLSFITGENIVTLADSVNDQLELDDGIIFLDCNVANCAIEFHAYTGSSAALSLADGAGIFFTDTLGTEWGSPTGGHKGASTINVAGGYYTNGVASTLTIGNSTATMTTSAISSGACGSTVSVAVSGVATTDSIEWAYNAAPSANPAELVISAWPTSGHVNFQYCNPTAGSVTPNAATLNFRVLR